MGGAFSSIMYSHVLLVTLKSKRKIKLTGEGLNLSNRQKFRPYQNIELRKFEKKILSEFNLSKFTQC